MHMVSIPEEVGVGALLRRLESERGQVVRPEQVLRLDLGVKLLPRDLYRLEVLAAYFGVSRRDLAAQLLAASLAKAMANTPDVGDDLDEADYARGWEERDYWTRRIDAMRQDWKATATINAPDQCESEREDERSGEGMEPRD
jgi:hypothetical protein